MSAAMTGQHLDKVRGDISDCRAGLADWYVAADSDSREAALHSAIEALLRATSTTVLAIEGIVQELKATAQGGVSSVELEQNSKGINVTAKAYVGSPVREAGDEALAELQRLINAVREAQARDWAMTVDGLRAERVAEGVGDP